MRDGRHLAALLIVLGVLALAVPAVALAGGSAGNNQYTNPFGSTTTAHTTTTPPQTSSTAAPSPTTASAPSSASAPPTTPASPETATTSAVTSGDPTGPTATAASPGDGTSTVARGLPRTGYVVWEIAGFGLVMLAGGFVIRRRACRS